jgi:hypothetical protein
MAYARDTFEFFMCAQCHSPFYGGQKACEGLEPERPPEEYKCMRCLRQCGELQTCTKHGSVAMVMKCFWCCSAAPWLCGGTTYYCQSCHRNPGTAVAGPWPQCDGKCAFAPHSPNGTRKFHGYCAMCETQRETHR